MTATLRTSGPIAKGFTARASAGYSCSGSGRSHQVTLRGVLFDMDGVLVHSEEAWFVAMNEVAEELGCAPIAREDFDRGWGQGVAEDAEEHYGGIDPSRLEQLYTVAVARHLHHLEVPRPSILDEVRALGLRVGVVTNTPQPLADQSLELAGLSAEVVCAARAGLAATGPVLGAGGPGG